jgi:hypothetical protein
VGPAIARAVSNRVLRLIIEIIILDFVLEFRDAYLQAKRDRQSEIHRWKTKRSR